MNFLRKRMMGAALLLGACMAVAMSLPRAQAQVPVVVVDTFDGLPAAITNNATATIASTNGIITLRKNQGLAIIPTYAALAATTSNVVFRLTVSADGTTWTTTTPLEYHVAMNGTNILRGYKLFPNDVLNNVRYAKLHSIQNNAGSGETTAGLVVSSIQYSYFNP